MSEYFLLPWADILAWAGAHIAHLLIGSMITAAIIGGGIGAALKSNDGDLETMACPMAVMCGFWPVVITILLAVGSVLLLAYPFYALTKWVVAKHAGAVGTTKPNPDPDASGPTAPGKLHDG